jgi:hypothetical protein
MSPPDENDLGDLLAILPSERLPASRAVPRTGSRHRQSLEQMPPARPAVLHARRYKRTAFPSRCHGLAPWSFTVHAHATPVARRVRY